MRFSSFQAPSEENLAMMNIPPYREILEVGLRGFIHDIFGKKETNPNYDLKKQGKPAAEPAQEDVKSTPETEKKPFWQSMKEIFKKKSK